MNRQIQGWCCRRLRYLLPVLKNWINANGKIAATWKNSKDAPWCNNERSSLSVFAGSVWRAGGFAFEEYSDEKRSILRKSSRLSKPYQGRVDFYFKFSGKEFIAEVKQVWSGYTVSRVNPCPRLDRALKSARRDIRKSLPYGQHRLAFLFAMPYFQKRAKDSVSERVEMWIKAIRDLDYDALAWVFPSDTRHLSDGEYYYPGVALAIKEVKR
ncbi:MAG: hypothetical protein COZ69_10470 [Deltaproteobacteria bacterium CG_4_8_14_3_um_filter_45_9]|nr:MAG: hypothetical protein COS40_02685 [Deltaproteobacteria bacterium CG03_land_8_20_14_0_80_45_14]PIX22702.1 MAG: hypothetical protein COZ69_10470 [Deltaproteobacteria bacterium CG_4_8_14_3_um_filter_45_9]